MVETPVLFITFVRPDYARQTWEGIKAAKPKTLYFYSNKGREEKEGEKGTDPGRISLVRSGSAQARPLSPLPLFSSSRFRFMSFTVFSLSAFCLVMALGFCLSKGMLR